MKQIIRLFTPFKSVPQPYIIGMFVLQIAAIMVYFQFFNGSIVPKPTSVMAALKLVVTGPTFIDDLLKTLFFTIKSTFLVIIISTILAYLSFLPSWKLFVDVITKLRFLTLTGALFVLTFMYPSASALKMAVMFFGMIPFFVTTLLSALKPDPQLVYLSKTLRLSNWEALYETVVNGKKDQIIETVRSNFAIAWLMITIAEGVAMNEGGLGTMILKLNKHIGEMPKVLAIQFIILLLGMGFDYLYRSVRTAAFPYIPKETKNV